MAMSENGKNVLEYLKQNQGEDLTGHDIAEALGIKLASVTGSVNALVKKGYAVRNEAEVTLEDGTHKKVKYIALTDEGLDFVPTEE